MTVRKRQLKTGPSSSHHSRAPPHGFPSSIEELQKMKVQVDEEIKHTRIPPHNIPKLRLVPFHPSRNQHNPSPSHRLPKKGPIPPFKKPLSAKPKDEKESKPPSPSKGPFLQFPLNNLMKDAMENIPNAIQSLPNFMQTLISNHASFVGSGRSFKDGLSLSNIHYTDEEKSEENKKDDKLFTWSKEESLEEDPKN